MIKGFILFIQGTFVEFICCFCIHVLWVWPLYPFSLLCLLLGPAWFLFYSPFSVFSDCIDGVHFNGDKLLVFGSPMKFIESLTLSFLVRSSPHSRPLLHNLTKGTVAVIHSLLSYDHIGEMVTPHGHNVLDYFEYYT